MSLRWWPASLVSGAVGGGVIGTLFSAELAGEAPEEGYDGVDPKSADGAAAHGRTRTGRARKR
jgi:hypothetical protein